MNIHSFKNISFVIFAFLLFVRQDFVHADMCLSTTHVEREFCGNGVCDNRYPICESSSNCRQDCGVREEEGCTAERDTCSNCNQPLESIDLDEDMVPDLLEYQLAHNFFPDVALQSLKHDLKESYFYHGFSSPFTVRPISRIRGGICDEDFECLELRISITFFNDAGWPGVLGVGTGSHRGDAEMYMAILRRSTPWNQAKFQLRQWRMVRDFTSAHWKRKTGFISWDSSKVKKYSPSRTNRVQIFCSMKKHALYHSRSACEDGAHHTDKCPNSNPYNLRDYKTSKLQNIGSQNVRGRMDTTIAATNKCGEYGVWSGGNYDGEPFSNYFNWNVDWKLYTGPIRKPRDSDAPPRRRK